VGGEDGYLDAVGWVGWFGDVVGVRVWLDGWWCTWSLVKGMWV
jgi:hypothetical protein